MLRLQSTSVKINAKNLIYYYNCCQTFYFLQQFTYCFPNDTLSKLIVMLISWRQATDFNIFKLYMQKSGLLLETETYIICSI